ncbi:MAG: Nif11-like leader peptide family RiPP precursor [Clostridia bacterium]|nr:Nif11-like leader peptide family RiPP precursor [Clostridia bacterium]
MKNLDDLKEAMRLDEDLKNRFLDLNSKEEAVILAEKMGYKITIEDLENDEEINEAILETIAGGKKGENVEVKVADIGLGNNTKIVNEEDINKKLDYFDELVRRLK